MKIYLDRNLQQIKVFKDLMTLINNLLSSNSELNLSKDLDLSELYKISHINDPVKELFEFYSLDTNTTYDEGNLDYFINSLYTSKGSIKVLDLFAEYLGGKIEYQYKFPDLVELNFIEIKVSNINVFVEKFEYALDYLLFYDKAKVYIENYILSISDLLVNNQLVNYKGYRIFECTNQTDSVSIKWP